MKHVLILTAILCSTTVISYAQAAEPKQKTINVTGTAEAEIVPDEIYVQVDLKEYDKRGVGKISLDNIKSDFLTACKSIGIADSDITVQAYAGSGNYWVYKKTRKNNPDLKASISYWVKLATTQKMDELVDKLDDDATQNFFIAKVDYSKRIELKKQLKIDAIKAAKAKAVYLTDAINEHIGGAVIINDQDDEEITPNDNYRSNSTTNFTKFNFSTSTDDNSSSNVGFQKIKFQFKVSVVFALE